MARGAELVTGVVDGLSVDEAIGRGDAASPSTAPSIRPTSSCSPSGRGPARPSGGSPCRRCSGPRAPASSSAPTCRPRSCSASSSTATAGGAPSRCTRAPAGPVYVAGHPEHDALPDDPDDDRAERRRLRRAPPDRRRARERPGRGGGGRPLGLLPPPHGGRDPADRPGPRRPGRVPGDRARVVGDPQRPGHRPDDQRDDPGRRVALGSNAGPFALSRLPAGRI